MLCLKFFPWGKSNKTAVFSCLPKKERQICFVFERNSQRTGAIWKQKLYFNMFRLYPKQYQYTINVDLSAPVDLNTFVQLFTLQ